MNQETILCIPGPWANRSDFLRAIITSHSAGEFMFALNMLADVSGKDHVPLTYNEADPKMSEAFRLAGQGKLSEVTLTRIASHTGVAYLHFPLEISSQRNRLEKFSHAVQRAGGYAVKVESSGVAHEWARWFSLLSGSTFQLYCSVTTLIGDDDDYYSCGMHHFGLPECSVPRVLAVGEAADLMNRFNLYQIVEKPPLVSGHTFSLSPESPHFRLELEPDGRHQVGDLFHNARGVWRLSFKTESKVSR